MLEQGESVAGHGTDSSIWGETCLAEQDLPIRCAHVGEEDESGLRALKSHRNSQEKHAGKAAQDAT